MKRMVFALLVLMACHENEILQSDFTGSEIVYPLLAGSSYPISGTVTVKEKTDGSCVIITEISGVSSSQEHPVHLHLGPIGTANAPVAALLNPIVSKSNIGNSETLLNQLADESKITYNDFIKLNGCIKIHLADSGADRDVILAAGNIGSAIATPSNARSSIGICQ